MLGKSSSNVQPLEPTNFYSKWLIRIVDQSIRLSKAELGEYRHRPGLVELADGSGYFATLSAYHSLHCSYAIPASHGPVLTTLGIKKLHHLMYFEHYYPNMNERQAMLIRHHAGKQSHSSLPTV